MALVLVADDEPGMLDLICDVVRELGHECVFAADGDEALQVARERRPQLILSDYMMPGRTGLDLIRALRIEPDLAQVPVVLMSAARPRAADEAWRFLEKPLELAELERAIAEGVESVTRPPTSATAPTNVSPLTLAREDMLNWVAHEIKSPLAAALVATQLIKRDVERGDLPRSPARRLATIERQLRHMDELITSILDAARLEEGRLPLERALADLSEVAEAAVEGWRDIHPDVEFSVQALNGGANGGPQVAIDRQRFRQILDNLLSNAVKYGVPPRRIEVLVGSRDGEAFVTVRDFGRGIPASQLRHVFDRFHRVEGMGGRGHGLGLYICSALARLHDGRIEVESAEGQGAAFTVTVPIADHGGDRVGGPPP